MLEKYIYIVRKREKRPLICSLAEYEYSDIYEKLDISKKLKQEIKDKIFLKKNFIIEIPILKILVHALEVKIEELLKHPDFDPFKEELRSRFPAQYSSYPFEYKGVIYYLYYIGRNFYIDNLISEYSKRSLIMKELIQLNEPLEYTFKYSYIK